MFPTKILETEGQLAINYINQLGKMRNIEYENFKIQTNPSFPKQRDGFNCGVLVIYSVDLLVNCNFTVEVHLSEVEKYLNALNKYRNYLQKLLVSESLSVKYNCLICFNIVAQTDQNYEHNCKICNRIIHYSCLTKNLIMNNTCKFCR